LRPTDGVLRAHVGLVATALPLLVRVAPLKVLLRLMTPPARFQPYRGVPAGRIAALVARRLLRLRHMRRRACLRHGLVLYHFLRLAGVPAMLQFGVYPPDVDPGRLHAHCWVTVDGVALTEPPGGRSAVLLAHGGAAEKT
jgi:hypothetical protein